MTESYAPVARVGQRVGSVVLVSMIGHGGMGEVWSAKHDAHDVLMAVKLLRVRPGEGDGFAAALDNEVRALAGLNDPGIVRLVDFCSMLNGRSQGLPLGLPWLLMERVQGETLLDRGRHLQWEGLRRWLLDLLDSLAHMHARRVVHRDLKPSNLRWCPVARRPKIVDFGIAAMAGHCDLFAHAGTPHFAAPEQLVQGGQVGPWTDLYALGRIALALVRNGRRTAPMKVPAAAHSWIAQLVQPDFTVRFQHAADAAAALLAPGGALVSVDWTGEPLQGVVGPTRVTGVVPLTQTELSGMSAQGNVDVGDLGVGTVRLKRAPLPKDWRVEVQVWQRLGWSRPAAHMRGLLRPAVVGRDVIQDELWAWLGAALAGEGPRSVLLCGPPRVGRTRLVEWLAHRAYEVGAVDLVWSDDAVDLEQVVSDLGRPKLLVIDGARACPELVHALVQRALALEPVPIVIATCRTRGDRDEQAWRAAFEALGPVLPMGPLSTGPAAKVAMAFAPLTWEAAIATAWRCGGVPGAIAETVAVGIADGEFQKVDGVEERWGLTTGFAWGWPTPPSGSSRLMAAIHSLSTPGRDTLVMAALHGGTIDAELLAAQRKGRDGQSLTSQIERLIAASWLCRTEDGGLAFCSAEKRDACLSWLRHRPERVPWLSELVDSLSARLIEDGEKARHEEDPWTWMICLQAIYLLGWTQRYHSALRICGSHALARDQLGLAKLVLSLLDGAPLDDKARTHLWLLQSWASGREEQDREIITELFEAGEHILMNALTHRKRALVLDRLVSLSWRDGALSGAGARYAALALSEALDTSHVVRALYNAGGAFLFSGHPTAGLRCFQRGLAQCSDQSQAHFKGHFHTGAALCLVGLRDFERAELHLQKGAAVFVKTGKFESLANNLDIQSIAAFRSGDAELARQRSFSALSTFAKVGVMRRPVPLINLAVAWIGCGESIRAELILEEAWRQVRSASRAELVCAVHVLLLSCAAHRGDAGAWDEHWAAVQATSIIDRGFDSGGVLTLEHAAKAADMAEWAERSRKAAAAAVARAERLAAMDAEPIDLPWDMGN